MQRRQLIQAGLALSLAVGATGLARADTFPFKPIRLVVTQGPGSGSDISGRLIAAKLGELLKHNVFVENKVGASGIIGHEYVKNAPADGYTLLFSSTAPLVLVPAMNSNAKYRMTDFTPVAPVLRAPYMIVTSVQPGAPGTTGARSGVQFQDVAVFDEVVGAHLLAVEGAAAPEAGELQ